MKNYFFGFVVGVVFLTASMQVQALSLTGSQWQIPLKNALQSTALSQYKGKVIWLDFWASWCPPCRQSFPWMNSIQQRFASKGLKVVAINVDENTQDAVSFLHSHSAQFDIYFDPNGSAPSAFNIQGMPTSLLIDRQGNIVLTHVGFEESQKPELEHKIIEALEK